MPPSGWCHQAPAKVQGWPRATGVACHQKGSRKPEHLSDINWCSWQSWGLCAWPWGEDTDVSWSRLHLCYLPSAGFFRHIAFLISLLHLSITRLAIISQSTSLAMCWGGCGADLGLARRGVDLGGANPCPRSCSPSASFGSSFLSDPPHHQASLKYLNCASSSWGSQSIMKLLPSEQSSRMK